MSTLADAPLGVPLVVSAVAAERINPRRLASLGVRSGTVLTLLSRTVGGGRVASVGGSRVALGAEALTAVSAEVAP